MATPAPITTLYTFPGGYIPTSIAIDNSGYVYVPAQNTITKYNTNTNTIVYSVTLSNNISLITVDNLGYLYAVQDNNYIGQYYTSNGSVVTNTLVPLSSPYGNITGITADSLGNLYFSDINNDIINKYTASTNSVSIIVNSISNPTNITIDNLGYLYVIFNSNIQVAKYDTNGSYILTLPSGFVSAFGITTDNSGNLYITDYYLAQSFSTIGKFNASNGALLSAPFATANPSSCLNIASDTFGNLYVITNDFAGGNTFALGKYTNNQNVVCFKEDTKILTENGYVLVQNLRKGDLIKTSMDGFKAISMIGKKDIYHPVSEERIKDQLYTCSHEQYPEVFEDLVITGCHSILVDDFKDDNQKEQTKDLLGKIYVTDEKYRLPACLDERACVYDKQGTYTIYHFALENENYYYNYGVYANGLLVETCSQRYLKELAEMTLIE
jgi:streptogramin lyase